MGISYTHREMIGYYVNGQLMNCVNSWPNKDMF